jgi:hypothetical protein
LLRECVARCYCGRSTRDDQFATCINVPSLQSPTHIMPVSTKDNRHARTRTNVRRSRLLRRKNYIFSILLRSWRRRNVCKCAQSFAVLLRVLGCRFAPTAKSDRNKVLKCNWTGNTFSAWPIARMPGRRARR